MSDPTKHSWPAGTRRLRVHDVVIDLRYRRVIRPDHEAELPHRMFDLLLVFLSEPQVLHSRAELFARVWPGVIVEDANLSQSIWMLRKALGESRKHWIRTVAKSGYVFEPPGPVEVMAEAIAEAAAGAGSAAISNVSGTDPASASATRAIGSAAPASAPRRAGWLRWGVVAALAIALIGGFAGWLHQRDRPEPQAAPPRQLAIALIAVEDQAAPEEARWPVTLLYAWLRWKLESLPEATLLTEAHLAADSQGRSPRVVFLSSGQESGSPNTIFLHARFDQNGREHRFEQRGTPADLPAMADRLSQQVLAALVPARARESWPPLSLDTRAARRYTEGIEALERRDWVASAQILRDVVQRAPDFGLARMQLGHALTRLSNAAPAMEQTDAALERLQPVPRDVAAVLHAERLSRDPQRPAEAAAAFAALASRHPGKLSYALDQARMLRRAGKFKEALAILNEPRWDGETVGNRLDRHLNLAATYLSMGDAEHAREAALVAERIARAAGKGWEQERGEALLLVAHADQFQYQEKADLSRYEEAAAQFERAGDDMGALIARFSAESAKPDPASRMQTLLMQARERGYRRLEIEILRVVAFRHYSEGDMPAYRARLEQALATALTAGDIYQQHLLELDLLNEDFMRGRFQDADRRLANLRRSGLQGDNAIWVAQYDALVAANRGQFALAEAKLEQAAKGDREANPGTVATTATSRISCLRADLRLVQGDMALARAEWRNCEASGQPSAQQQSRIGNASIDLYAGDRAAALRQFRDFVHQADAMQDGPDRWIIELTLATFLTRAGDVASAQRLYERVLPLATQSDYGWMVAIAEAGLAETAATRSDWKAVRGHLVAARRQRVSDVWTLSNRLDVLDVVLALVDGDGRRAAGLLASVHAKAQRNNDVVTQLEIYSLLPPGAAIGECNERCQAALVARTGLRGANLDWLRAPSRLDTSGLKPGVVQ